MTVRLLMRGAGSDRRPVARPHTGPARLDRARLAPARLAPARLATALLATALLASGCAVGGDEDAASPTPRPDLAQKAEVGARNRATQPDRVRGGRNRTGADRADRGGAGRRDGGTATRRAGTSRSGSGTAGSDDGPAASGGPAGAGAGERVLVAATDHTGDHGLGADYGDLTGLDVVDAGDTARLTVTVAATVPARLADGEVMGVGVDVYRSDARESDYQVFLDGGSDGWVAHLQTPRGFVRFPGSFTLDGNRLVVRVPWAALGGESAGTMGAFVDWTNALALGTNDDAGRHALAPG